MSCPGSQIGREKLDTQLPKMGGTLTRRELGRARLVRTDEPALRPEKVVCPFSDLWSHFVPPLNAKSNHFWIKTLSQKLFYI